MADQEIAMDLDSWTDDSLGTNIAYPPLGEMETLIATGEVAQSIDERGDLMTGGVIYEQSRKACSTGSCGRI